MLPDYPDTASLERLGIKTADIGKKKANHLHYWIFGITVLFVGLGLIFSSVYFEYQSQKTGQDEGSTSLEKQAEVVKVLGESVSDTGNIITSEQLGFYLRYNPTYWIAQSTDPSYLVLVLRGGYGSATVSVKHLGDYAPDLDRAVENLIKRDAKDKTTPRKLVNKEAVKFSGYDAYKLTFSQEILGHTINNYLYLLNADGKYFQINQSFSSLPNSEKLSEDLLQSLEFYGSKPQGLGVLGISDSQEGGVVLDQAKIVELVKPSVTNIIQFYCHHLGIKPGNYKFFKESYTVCDGIKGSGFVIGGEGYVATNGHVVKIYPEESMVIGFMQGSYVPFFVDLIKEISYVQNGIALDDKEATAVLYNIVSTPSGIESLLTFLYTLYDEKELTITEGGNKYWVRLGDEPFDLDEDKIRQGDFENAVTTTDRVLEAELVAYDFPNIFTSQSLLEDTMPGGSDVGILKLINPQGYLFPSLKFGSLETVSQGSELLIAGYPGLVEGDLSNKSLLTYDSSTQPTVTQGIVSSIKDAPDGKKLIQTDASIDHGSSGGPALNKDAQVVGIATYSFQSLSGNFNFLRDINDLEDLLVANNITLEDSSVYSNWEMGLREFWAGRYKRAIPYFQKVEEMFPVHPYVSSYLIKSEEAIAEGQDKSGLMPLSNLPFTVTLPMVLALVGGVVLILGTTILSIVIIVRKKASYKEPEVHPVTSLPGVPVMPGYTQGVSYPLYAQPVSPGSVGVQPTSPPSQNNSYTPVGSVTPTQGAGGYQNTQGAWWR